MPASSRSGTVDLELDGHRRPLDQRARPRPRARARSARPGGCPRARSRSSPRPWSRCSRARSSTLLAPGRVALQPPVQDRQLERRGHQPLLRAVVQVALDPPPRLVGSLHEPRPRRRQLFARLGALDRVARRARRTPRPGPPRPPASWPRSGQVAATGAPQPPAQHESARPSPERIPSSRISSATTPPTSSKSSILTGRGDRSMRPRIPAPSSIAPRALPHWRLSFDHAATTPPTRVSTRSRVVRCSPAARPSRASRPRRPPPATSRAPRASRHAATPRARAPALPSPRSVAGASTEPTLTRRPRQLAILKRARYAAGLTPTRRWNARRNTSALAKPAARATASSDCAPSSSRIRARSMRSAST